ncbi:hypothetical protein QTO17_01335 [Vibrio owensii]
MRQRKARGDEKHKISLPRLPESDTVCADMAGKVVSQQQATGDLTISLNHRKTGLQMRGLTGKDLIDELKKHGGAEINFSDPN